MMSKHLVIYKSIIFGLAISPFIFYLYQFIFGALANPVEYVTRGTGDWSLRFLLITLVVTPIRILTGFVYVVRFRRMLGLFTFFYVSVHLCIYFFIDVYLNADADTVEVWQYIKEDIVDRPFITIGFSAFLLLIPLAITSTKKFQLKLGKKWKKLHRIVYLIAVLGVIHFFWLVKKDLREPIIYASILGVLLLFRVKWRYLFRRM